MNRNEVDLSKMAMKSVSESSKYRLMGNELFAKKKLQSALEAYNNSILYAPTSSESYAFAFGNRSAVFYEMGAKMECARDINRALSCSTCPAALKEKLLLRKERCDVRIGEGRNSSRRGPMTKYGNCEIPPLSNGSNLNIPTISNQISMDHRPGCGRRLMANEEIKAGSVLIVEKPFASVILEQTRISHCHYCHEILPMDFIPCNNCSEVRFCSEECYESQEYSHSFECGEVERLLQGGLAYLVYKIFTVSSAKDLAAYFTCPHRTLQQSKLREGTFGMNQDECYDSGFGCVVNLLSHHKLVNPLELKVFEKTAESLAGLAASRKRWPKLASDLYQFSNYICDSCKSCPDLQRQPLAVFFLVSLFLRLIEMLICNAHAISALVRQDEGSSTEKVGELKIASAIYPAASLMNHSCRPNIFSSFIGKTQIVRASRNIAAGEEILNCYGPQFGHMLRPSRQETLKQQYYFDCVCTACTSEEMMEQEAYFTAVSCANCWKPSQEDEKWRAGSFAMLKSADGGQYVCKQCSGQKAVSMATDEISSVESDLTSALEKDSANEVERCFGMLCKQLYIHNKGLSEWRDKVAKWLVNHGNPEEALQLLEENLSTIQFIYGVDSIELANEIVKYFDVVIVTATTVNFDKVVDEVGGKSVLSELLTTTKKIFEVHYGSDCVQIKELEEVRITLSL